MTNVSMRGTGTFWPRWRARLWRLASILIALALLVGAVAWMSGALRTKVSPGTIAPERPTAAERDVVAVRTRSTMATLDAVGTVQPRYKTEVASQILATVLTVHVRPGDKVKEGDALLTLDDRDIQAQLREAEAAAAGARADMDVRAGDFKRYEQMFRENAVSREDYDRVEGAMKNARAQLQRLEEQVDRIRRVTLGYTKVNAREAGIVGDRRVDPGDLALPGKTLLTINDPAERELHASVPESLVSVLRPGLQLMVRVEAVGRTCHGVVREIVPEAQQASRSFLVKVTLPPEAVNRVSVGMFGRLTIPTRQIQQIVVPTAAVQQVGQQDLVDVVLPDNTLEFRFITTGQHCRDEGQAEMVEILSGLEVGQKVALPAGSKD
jgi:RND family efflux transporter MFP subunit